MGNSQDNKMDILKENNLTYDDYASFDDGNRYELVKGQLELMSPSPSPIHQFFNAEIFDQLSSTCKSDYFILSAPIDVILSPNEVRQPDLVLIKRERIDIITNRGIEGTPDLVIVVLSPSSLKRDKIDKLKTYAHFGISEYWIVDPNSESLEQYILLDRRYDLVNIFQDDEMVISPHLACASFTMRGIVDYIPELE